MKKLLTRGRRSPRPNFNAFTAAICSFAILFMSFAEIASARRLRSEQNHGSIISNQRTVSDTDIATEITDESDTGTTNDNKVTAVCATNLAVTNTNDSGTGSLREAITNLCPGGTISFDPALTSGGPATITLSSELVIDKNMTIDGPTNNGLTISGNNATRIFNINAGVTLAFATLTIANGSATNGGGILNAGTLTISNSTLNNNTTTSGADATGTTNGGNGGDGGAIYNTGTLTLINSTVGENQTGRGGDNFSGTTGNGGNSGRGAAIFSSGTVNLTNTTVTNNQSGRIGFVAQTDPEPPGVIGAVGTGGIFNGGGTLTLNNSIVSNNRDGFESEDDINGAVNPSSSFNFIGSNTGMTGISDGSNGNQIGAADNQLSALLGPLAFNGGPTRTYLPQTGSPVIDAGGNALAVDQNNNALTTDQRGAGFPRIINGTVEIGSVETINAPAGSSTDVTVTKSADPEQVLPDRDITYTITVSNLGGDPATNLTLTDTLPLVPASSPTSTTFVSLTPAPGWACTTPAVGSAGTVSCARASIAGNTVHTFTLVVHVPSSADPASSDPFITNSVTIAAENDANSENDTTTATTILVSCSTDPVVTTSADSGSGSLRQAIADACPGSTITFDMTPGKVVSPITLTNGELLMNKNLTIQGPAANQLTVIRSTAVGTPDFHILRIAAGNTVTISGLTLTNGVGTSGATTNGGAILNEGTLTISNSVMAGNAAAGGGGIYNAGGTLTVISSTISNNHADTGSGGGILSSGTLTIINSTIVGNTALSSGGIEIGAGAAGITNSTISGNSAIGDGGGIQVLGGAATLTNATVTANRSDSDNSGAGDGGGIRRVGGSIALRNTIVAGNYKGAGSSSPNDIAETVDVASSSFNLIGAGGTGGLANTNGNQVGVTNPSLGVLGSNGGPTDTHLLLPGSPAINAGSNALLPVDAFDLDGDANAAETLPVDQRGPGFPRIINTTVDIGAVEVNYSFTTTAGTPQSAPVNSAFPTALKATVTESGTPLSGISVTFTAPGSGASGTFPGSSLTAVVSTDANGVATAPTFTANAIGGSYNVVAGIGSGLPTATFALTNTKLDQTITFGVLADKTFGDPDFTVTATASSGLTVSFNASGNCTVSGNTVHLTGAGSCTITASQPGDATYNAAIPVSRSFNIAKAATSTAVSSSVNPSNPGQNVTFTATVTSAAGTPSGTVQFKDGGTNLGPPQSLNASGIATFSTSTLTAGLHTITAEYGGDANFLASAGTLSGGQQVGSLIRFSSATYDTTEGSGLTTITVERIGDLSQAVSVDYTTPDDSNAMTVLPCSTANGVASPRCDFTTALGTLKFAAGDASETFLVLVNQDNFVEGPEALTLTLSNPTGSAGFSAGATTITATLTIADDVTEPATNPIDNSGTFVRQHYHDFLNREADPAGLAFWTDNIDKCNDPARRPAGLTVAQCIESFRIHTSAAFYLSVEFQQSGYFVYRLYKAGFDDIAPPTVPVPVRYTQFIRDAAEVNRGVIVGQGNWENQLAQNKQALGLAFVQRPEFLSRYPAITSATAFVDTLDENAGDVLSDSQRSALISELSPNSSSPALRASVLVKVAENALLQQREFNRAFVLMQYFGYLRRNPDAAPEPGLNFDGYNFWLNKLNSFNGDFIKAEMVRAFISSGEYRRRFGH